MSRFYSETYKWSLYEKYRTGFTLTEICEISGITDKPLRESDSAIGGIPETLRIACASPLVNRYGPNRICQSLKIRKSNLFYHLLRKPEVTAYEKHNQKLRPAIQKICDTTELLTKSVSKLVLFYKVLKTEHCFLISL